jgi:hypothetical protein
MQPIQFQHPMLDVSRNANAMIPRTSASLSLRRLHERSGAPPGQPSDAPPRSFLDHGLKALFGKRADARRTVSFFFASNNAFAFAPDHPKAARPLQVREHGQVQDSRWAQPKGQAHASPRIEIFDLLFRQGHNRCGAPCPARPPSPDQRADNFKSRALEISDGTFVGHIGTRYT